MARKVKVQIYRSKSRKRKGIHSKTKCSKVKSSKNYKKKYKILLLKIESNKYLYVIRHKDLIYALKFP